MVDIRVVLYRTDSQTVTGGPMNRVADISIAVCSAVFITILGISAYWDRSIVALHFAEAGLYLVVAVLCLRQRKYGYALGVASGGFWLWMAGTRTTFVRNGFERVAMLLGTGHVDRWDQFIAAPAALATTGIVAFSLWGYSRARGKASTDVVLLAGAIGVVAGFFLAIFAAFAPQYLALFSRR